MTLQPPQYLQALGAPARLDRQLLGDFFDPGVVSPADFEVTSTGGSLSVSVAAGGAYVLGTAQPDQGTYRVFNDGPVIVPFDAAATYPRVDQVLIRVYDATENGGVGPNQAVIEIAKGTESNGATLINRSGAVADGSLPDNILRLKDVLVPVGVAPVIPGSNIGERRSMAGLKAGGSPPIGAIIPYAMVTEPLDGFWTMADGKLVDKVIYDKFFAGAGHSYNLGVDPGSNMCRVPDKRGRVSVGADDMGTLAGAASRIPNSNRVRGQNGGLERTVLSEANLAPHQHPLGSSATDRPAINVAGSDSNIGTGGPVAVLANTGSTGSGTPFNNMQPYEVDNAIVRIA